MPAHEHRGEKVFEAEGSALQNQGGISFFYIFGAVLLKDGNKRLKRR